MTQRALTTRMVGYTTDRTGHVMAPPEVVYEVDAPVRKAIPLKAKLWVISGCLMIAYGVIQGGINTFS